MHLYMLRCRQMSPSMDLMDVTWFPMPQGMMETSSDSTLVTRPVHFVGSLPLSEPEHVFRTLVERFPNQLQRIPDGHTGCRQDTFQWQMSMLCAAGLDHLIRFHDDFAQASFTDSTVSLSMLDTGFDHHAIASYSTFARLKLSGIIPRHVRFQISLPLPHSFTSRCILPAYRRMFEPYYDHAIKRALNHIQTRIPHLDLAIQIDCHSRLSDTSTDSAVDLINSISPDVQLGLHIHLPQESGSGLDLGQHVDLARSMTENARRPITYFHFPFPDGTSIESMQAMRSFSTASECEIYLGLVHGDREALKRRVVTAASVFGEGGFGIATPCGLGGLRGDDLQIVLQELKDNSRA